MAKIDYSETGECKRRNLKKYLNKRSEQAVAKLKQHKIFQVEHEVSSGSVQIIGRTDLKDWNPSQVSQIASMIIESANILAFHEG